MTETAYTACICYDAHGAQIVALTADQAWITLGAVSLALASILGVWALLRSKSCQR